MSKANKGFKRERDSALSELEAQLRINARLRGEISVLKGDLKKAEGLLSQSWEPLRANLAEAEQRALAAESELEQERGKWTSLLEESAKYRRERDEAMDAATEAEEIRDRAEARMSELKTLGEDRTAEIAALRRRAEAAESSLAAGGDPAPGKIAQKPRVDDGIVI
jgi:chromosome segregation ATPase